MSECVCLLLLIGTVLIVDRGLFGGHERLWWARAAIAGVGSSMTFLARSMCVTLVVAIFVYFLIHKSFKSAGVFMAVVVIILMPWSFYVVKHSPTVAHKQELNSSVLYSYSEQFWMKSAGVPESGVASLGDIADRLRDNITNIAFRDVGCVVFPWLYRSAESSGMEILGLGVSNKQTSAMGMSTVTVVASGFISLLMLFGFVLRARRHLTLAEILLPVSLLIIVVWPWFSFRYVAIFIPFLLMYLFGALSELTKWLIPAQIAARGRMLYVVGAGMLLMIMIDHGAYILGKQGVAEFPSPVFSLMFDESQTALSVLAHVTQDDEVIGTDNPAQVNVYTNRKAIRRGAHAAENSRLSGGPAAGLVSNNRMINSMGDTGVRYLAKVNPLSTIEFSLIRDYTILYSSPAGIEIVMLGDHGRPRIDKETYENNGAFCPLVDRVDPSHSLRRTAAEE
jgi:hypothetical protein